MTYAVFVYFNIDGTSGATFLLFMQMTQITGERIKGVILIRFGNKLKFGIGILIFYSFVSSICIDTASD